MELILKIFLFNIVLIILINCNIYSQDKIDTSYSKEAGIVSAISQTRENNKTDSFRAENIKLSAKDIIKRARNFNLNSRIILKNYNLHIFSQTLVMYHLIDNPVQLITEYAGTGYDFLGANESEQFEYHKNIRNEDERKLIINSHRQTPLLEKTMTYNFYPDFFAEEMGLLNESIPGPLAMDCFENYTYKLIGIDSSSGRKIYRIRVKEKYTYIPSFHGTIYIEDSTFALNKVSLKTNLAINIPLLKEVHVKNSYKTFLDSNTMRPYSVPVFFDFNAIGSFAGAVKLTFDKYSETRNVNLKSDQKNIIYDEFEMVVADALKKTKEFWDKNGLRMNDTLVSKELAKIYTDKFKHKSSVTFTGSGLRFGEHLTWNMLYFYTFNRIEGNHIELNTTYERNFKRFILDSRLIYGTANQQFTYSFNLALLPSKRMNVLPKADVFSRLTPFKSWAGSITLKMLYQLCSQKEGWIISKEQDSCSCYYRISKSFTLGADYFQEKQSSVSNNTNFSFVKKNSDYGINPQINDGIIKKISFNLNVDLNNYRMIDWGDGDVSRIRLSLLPVMEFRYSYSDKKVIKSTYDFKEYHVKITGSVVLGRAIKLIYKGGAKLKYGTVPYQELNAVDPKFLGLPNDVSMITPDYSEFLGDRIIFLNLENEFGKIFPFDIPVLSSITLLGELCFGKTWISDENRRLSSDKNYKSTAGIFTEIGFGLTRILEVGTLRYAWRLNNFKEGSDTFLFFDVGIRY
jgi:hypothetical protein